MPAPRKFRSFNLRILLLTAAGALLTATAPAAAAESHLITSNSVSGARLGLTERDYTRKLGRLHFTTKFPGGLTRLEYRKGEIHVFLLRATGKGVGFFTAAEEYKTSTGVGPCTPVAKLRAKYGSRLVPVKNATSHQVVAYRLGTITFVTTGPDVRSVLVSAGRIPLQTALNGAACGSGEED